LKNKPIEREINKREKTQKEKNGQKTTEREKQK
jgi:hypothetical protein